MFSNNYLIKACLLVAMLPALASCASITSGQNQSLSVKTIPVPGATCNLTNDDGSWFVNNTPGSVVVDRSMGDLSVICTKEGYTGSTVVESQTKGLAFGNLVAGGIIGAAVDMGTGAAYDYPSLITVEMHKNK